MKGFSNILYGIWIRNKLFRASFNKRHILFKSYFIFWASFVIFICYVICYLESVYFKIIKIWQRILINCYNAKNLSFFINLCILYLYTKYNWPLDIPLFFYCFPFPPQQLWGLAGLGYNQHRTPNLQNAFQFVQQVYIGVSTNKYLKFHLRGSPSSGISEFMNYMV